jgi:acetate kinase
VNVLTVNPGSSSVKLAVIDDRNRAVITRGYGTDDGSIDASILRRLLEAAPPIHGTAVRLVHGGEMVRSPTLVDAEFVSQLSALADLAPLHNTAAIRALEVLRDVMPETPIVVCVDSAFHATIPEEAATYAIPWEWTQRHGFRKYGFHGLSHGYASRRAGSLLERPVESLRLVTCHLGAGASLAAIVGGISVDTTMGFTPLDGLVMATRPGSVDPGILTRIQRAEGITATELEDQLERHSGLLGISGRSGDLQVIVAAAADGDVRARLAIDVMVHRVVTSIGAMTAAAGGLDALVFTGGIGERSAPVRRGIAARLGFLGIALGPANETVTDDDVDVSAPDATTRTLVVHAREDLELAREARALLRARPDS